MRMQTIPDSNVLLDVIYEDSPWSSWSLKWLSQFQQNGELVTNAVIFSEASGRFQNLSDARSIMSRFGIAYEDIPEAAAHVAGLAHAHYRSLGGERTRTLPDFLIGAHAKVRGHRLITRDASRYRTYFPSLEIIAPDTHP
jgi:predicted nucleic acid-binding protein